MGLLLEAMLFKTLAASPARSALATELAIMHLIRLGFGRESARLPALTGSTIDEIARTNGPGPGCQNGKIQRLTAGCVASWTAAVRYPPCERQ